MVRGEKDEAARGPNNASKTTRLDLVHMGLFSSSLNPLPQCFAFLQGTRTEEAFTPSLTLSEVRAPPARTSPLFESCICWCLRAALSLIPPELNQDRPQHATVNKTKKMELRSPNWASENLPPAADGHRSRGKLTCARGGGSRVHVPIRTTSLVCVYDNPTSPPKCGRIFAGWCALSISQPPLRPIMTCPLLFPPCASHSPPLHSFSQPTHHTSQPHLPSSFPPLEPQMSRGFGPAHRACECWPPRALWRSVLPLALQPGPPLPTTSPPPPCPPRPLCTPRSIPSVGWMCLCLAGRRAAAITVKLLV